MDMIVRDLSPRNAGGIPDTEEGQKNFMQMIVTRIAEGESLASRCFSNGEKVLGIAESLGIPFSVIWRWMESKPDRVLEYESALRARADAMVSESLSIVMETNDKDDVPASALKAGHLLKVAKYWDRARYGDKPEKDSGGNFTVVVNRGGALNVVVPGGIGSGGIGSGGIGSGGIAGGGMTGGVVSGEGVELSTETSETSETRKVIDGEFSGVSDGVSDDV